MKNNLEELEISIVDEKDNELGKIPHFNLVDYNTVMNIGSFTNEGTLVFYDYEHLFTIYPMLSNYRIKIYFKDRVNNEQTEYYNIYDIKRTFYRQQVYIITLRLMDELSYALSRISFSKGFKNSSLIDILKYVITLVPNSNTENKEIISNVEEKNRKYCNSK